MCSRLSVERGHRIFLLGGENGVAEKAARVLEASFPGITVCGAHSPPAGDYPFSDAIEADIELRLAEARPDIVFVGFGCPKQEQWIRDHRDAVAARVYVGTGGSFNFITGLVPRAPRSMQHLGLEWVYRLYKEPRRLWRRYLQQDLPFTVRLARMEIMRRLGLRPESIFDVEA
jgi:N-acetylglucosaminyldiphosphoundecaprenol N-acetyl-beta-D-mannosaminyltransferase